MADPFVISGWVKTELGAVDSETKSGLVIIVCVSAGQREKALRVKRMGARNGNCFDLKKKAPLKGLISGVAVNVKVDQLKGKIPSVCDACCLVRHRQGGMRGETEVSLFFLSFLFKKICISPLFNQVGQLRTSSRLQLRLGQDKAKQCNTNNTELHME